MQLDNALAEIERLWPGRFSLLGLLAQGTANHLWRLGSKEGDVVLRLHGPDTGVEVDRDLEAKAWQQASAIDRAPALLHFDSGLSLARWGGESPRKLAIAPLVELLLALHRLPPQGPRLEPLAEIRHYEALAAQSLPDDIQVALLDCWQAVQATALAPGFCHMDLHAGNLVVDEHGHWRALDFEYVRMAVPQFDLAPALLSLPVSQGRALWHEYLAQRAVNQSEAEWRSQVAAVCLASGLGWAWALAQKNPGVAREQSGEFESRLREWLDKFAVC